MHLLAATPGAMSDEGEAVDLQQTPADLIVISSADSELSALSDAAQSLSINLSVRLANMMHLRHPMSVDLHLDSCAQKSRLVIARFLGGAGYWPYALSQYAARLYEAGICFVALPGDDKPDLELRELSTCSNEDYDALWAYLIEGGSDNCQTFLRYAHAIIHSQPRPELARPLLKAGVYDPLGGVGELERLRARYGQERPVVAIVFYRALMQGGGLEPIQKMAQALVGQGVCPLPIFVSSLKDPLSLAVIDQLFQSAPPQVILNCTAFAVGSAHEAGRQGMNPLTLPSANEAPVFQVVLSGSSLEQWKSEVSGLSGRDIAMNVALPEVDGRILTRAVSFKGENRFDEGAQCAIVNYDAQEDRILFVAQLAANWCKLRNKAPLDRKVALILANYPNKDGRLANGVGLDTPSATVEVLTQLQTLGYRVEGPNSSDELMAQIMNGPTNWLTDRTERQGGARLCYEDYMRAYDGLPKVAREAIETRWGAPTSDPFFDRDEQSFALSCFEYGSAIVCVQPARGYNIDPVDTYHAPDLVPPHNYLAFYFYLRNVWGADAIVHMGKHGNLEWLPGKAVALSETCWPEIALGAVPHVYPFIVNDPGEGTQAKRRSSAVIIDHLTPPLTRAETYGPLRDLEALVDEYYEAAGVDPRRIEVLKREILSLSSVTGICEDVGFVGDEEQDLGKLDAYLCELKEAQIRDGLHIFGQSPKERLLRDLVIALARLPRGDGHGQNASLLRAMAIDLSLSFDPLSCDMSELAVVKPDVLLAVSDAHWRSLGDTVERLELLAQIYVDAILDRRELLCAEFMVQTHDVLTAIMEQIAPVVQACGPAEIQGIQTALGGRFVPPGPSGAPTRGRLDVLPTGRNFYSVDCRAVPTTTAWTLGWASADLLLERHLQDHGEWPKSLLLTAWGTANMRTGGDDIAQAFALMGVKPTWESASRRVTGFEIIPMSALGRPRVDITLRISGFFRDAFPQLIELVDRAARAVQALDEVEDDNPAAARFKRGEDGARVFGSKPGAYGAGLQAMIDERLWRSPDDLAQAYLEWGSYAYGTQQAGVWAKDQFKQRLSQSDAIVQNQDNKEHDLLDSDDYYQFEGGASAAISMLQGRQRPIYHNDHSRPERPVIRTLDDEIGRVVRSRVVNPKWIDGVKRHGYKGAFEMAATVDYLFAFAATTGAVKHHHFDLVEAAFLEDEDTRLFIEAHNAPALGEIAERLQEAIDRGLWVPKSNSVHLRLNALVRAKPTFSKE